MKQEENNARKERLFVTATFLEPFGRFSRAGRHTVEFWEGDTFKDLIIRLIERLGHEFEKTLFDKNMKIADHVMVLLDGKRISSRKDSGFRERLKNGQEYIFCAAKLG